MNCGNEKGRRQHFVMSELMFKERTKSMKTNWKDLAFFFSFHLDIQ